MSGTPWHSRILICHSWLAGASSPPSQTFSSCDCHLFFSCEVHVPVVLPSVLRRLVRKVGFSHKWRPCAATEPVITPPLEVNYEKLSGSPHETAQQHPPTDTYQGPVLHSSKSQLVHATPEPVQDKTK
ncbi:hypothetical protein PAXRUDRAFT_318427 [Paxillus rubicundulus Ve08.2h10]|uniref:Uncharacterized protein n=1 Tax=Paxillus rubicundulus Ve08.2h10 TaxID=930991 RepID=A0A0D0C645_9AGAM|nr:hypothetical protein PAXRUDRAFT_318427 [Paxillus rubicundulus Ve08.2h10]